MRMVKEFELSPGENKVEVVTTANVLGVVRKVVEEEKSKREVLMLCMEVDTKSEKVKRIFLVVATGEEIKAKYVEYIGSCLMMDTTAHVFEVV